MYKRGDYAKTLETIEKKNRKETADNLGKTIIRQAVTIPKEVLIQRRR